MLNGYVFIVSCVSFIAASSEKSAFLICYFIPSPGVIRPEPLRESLKSAMREKDIENLQRVIDECEAAGLRELDSDLSLAKELLATLTGRAGSTRTLLVCSILSFTTIMCNIITIIKIITMIIIIDTVTSRFSFYISEKSFEYLLSFYLSSSVNQF